MPTDPYIQALLDAIARGESPDYNIMYGGGRFNSYADHPRVQVPITSGPNVGRTSSAAGRYQFLAPTWDAEKNKLGLQDFSPASQDAAAADLASSTYKSRTGNDLAAALHSGDPQTIGQVGNVLHNQWTSLPGGIEASTNTPKFANLYQDMLAARQGAQTPAVPGLSSPPPSQPPPQPPASQQPPGGILQQLMASNQATAPIASAMAKPMSSILPSPIASALPGLGGASLGGGMGGLFGALGSILGGGDQQGNQQAAQANQNADQRRMAWWQALQQQQGAS